MRDPTGTQSARLMISMPPALLKKINRICRDNFTTRSEWLRQAAVAKLERDAK